MKKMNLKMLALVVIHLALSMLAHGQDFTEGCGDVKGCSRTPDDCVGDACEFVFTWTPPAAGATKMTFEIQGKVDGWAAVGLSNDQKMGVTSVMECKKLADGTVEVGLSYNGEGIAPSAITPYEKGISDASGSFTDGLVKCTFSRDLTVDDPNVFPLASEYFFLLGRGEVKPNGNKNKHAALPVITSTKIDVTKDVSSGGAGQVASVLVQAHGILMITAWTICVCTAVLLARFYKQGWPEKLLCDKKPVWFSVHRVLNIITLLSTVAAFVIIFVEVRGYTAATDVYSTAHPILGIIVTALCVINPTMAIFRPHPDGERRWIFNWAHWGVGSLAQACAAATIYLGMLQSKAEVFTQEYVRYVMGAFIALYIVTVIILEIHKCVAARDENENKQEFELQSPGADGSQKTPQRQTFKYIVFAFYLLFSLALYVTMIASIVIGK